MKYNEIGRIATTHALKGEVKIKTDSSFIDERFKVGASIYIKENNDYKELIVNSHRSMKGYELVSFKGYETIDSVMIFIGKTIYGIKDRNLLTEGENFYSDFINMDVYQFNELKGKVLDIVSYPHQDYFKIESVDKKEKLVPLRKEFIEDVDIDNNKLTIVDMEGLL